MSRLSTLLIPLVIAFVAVHPAIARTLQLPPIKGPNGPLSVLVTDGSPVHTAGNLRVHASNWGAIGSMPGAGVPYSNAPSAEWPAGSGVQYLFVAGLWVGALVNGAPAVSTSAFELEFRPSSDSRDVVYLTADGIQHGDRIPYNPDDDRDGTANEDPQDGFDNDLDGAVDEDYAAISDQMMSRRFRDDQPGITSLYPAHTPMHLEVREESYAFTEPDYDDFVGFSFAITNTGDDVLHDVYVGLLADGDVGASSRPNYWEDDATGIASVPVDLGAHGVRTVSFPYWYDADGDGGEATGRCGFVLLDHTTDPDGLSAPDSVSLGSWLSFDGSVSYEDGGTPTDDFQRYEAMSSRRVDRPDLGDIRALMAVGPFPTVAPGQTITFTVALVVTPDDFSNVGRAVEAYNGQWFDLDHNPATGVNGKEHQEPWYLPGDQMAPVWLSGFEVGQFGGAARLRWGVVADQALQSIEVLRGPIGDGEPALIATLPGSAREFVDKSATSGARYAYTIVVHGVYGASATSPALEFDVPKLPTTLWVSYPNPFRESTTISAHLAERADMSLMVFDAGGRRVVTLASGVREAGEEIVTWNGTDDAGRRVPSGVYFCRLKVGDKVLSQKLMIMR